MNFSSPLPRAATGSVPICSGSPTSDQFIVTAQGGNGFSVVRPYADIMFMNDRSTKAIAPSGLFEFTNPLTPTGGMLVNRNNPFLSAQQQSAIGCTAADIAAGNNADLSICRRNVEGAPRVATYDHVNYRLVLGNKGSIGSAWTYDVYGSYYTRRCINPTMGTSAGQRRRGRCR